ncbi:DUF3320 domain-containing protein [Pararhodospirillum oryzae]|uniref:DNA helicase n=1 Tax=Pararhodospirillum oryzae TaxID=478448 RepID=A0A512H7N0_9PROT|nr:DUF3320 domain-containing protein [Pararhodospirillum oryzae]GEO81438.1 hypothetical protein ROR02_15690 [Pararhodospirillum oryzae]
MADPSVNTAPLRIEIALTPRLNLAFLHNAIPFLRDAVLVNDTKTRLDDVSLALSSDPPFLEPRAWHLEALAPGEERRLGDLEVSLAPGPLSRLTERETAKATFILSARGTEVARRTDLIELLPRDHWSGLEHVPEMIAAFVQPNEPALASVLVDTAWVLSAHDRPSALTGYDGGPRRVWELASALWSALSSRGLIDSLPPAGFEQAGQKVRAARQVLEGRLATCLDRAVLFCAALEQMHLHPLLVFTEGHALAGVWLHPQEFATPVIDDVTALRKRVALREIVLFETTLITHAPPPSFGVATGEGTRQIQENAPRPFVMAVDIRRARLMGLHPLASVENTAALPAPAAPGSEAARAPAAAFDPAPDVFDGPDPGAGALNGPALPPTTAPDTPEGRLTRWQRKLLDLSLRNPLLNLTRGRTFVRLIAPDPGLLEDLLADGAALKVESAPDLTRGAAPREPSPPGSTADKLALEALRSGKIQSPLPKAELETALVSLYRQARTALQEGGANTLFLTLGFLSWTPRDGRHQDPCRAPLLLMPVVLERRSVRSGFTMRRHEEDTLLNPTLVQLLRQDFDLALPLDEGNLPRDEHGLDLDAIWRAVRHAIKDIPEWDLSPEVGLSSFSFGKFLMWKDLCAHASRLGHNRLARHLIQSPREPYPDTRPFPDPRRLDQDVPPEDVFCPLPADSSQLSAVLAAAQGLDFVLIGPPGTGKSQTIANLIAHALAQGRTVLFVSEKMAALDVVYRRLKAVGLGPFCLELHSNKARRQDVLDQLREAWERRDSQAPGDWPYQVKRLQTLRQELDLYVERLHRPGSWGLTPFLAMGRVVAGRDLPRLGLSWPSPDAHDRAAYQALADRAHDLGLLARPFLPGPDEAEPNDGESGPAFFQAGALTLIHHTEWSPLWEREVLQDAQALAQAGAALETALHAFREAAGLPVLPLDREGRKGLATLASLLPRAGGQDWSFALAPDAAPVRERLATGLALVERRRKVLDSLPATWDPSVAHGVRKALKALEAGARALSVLALPVEALPDSKRVARVRAEGKAARQAGWLRRGPRTRALIQTLADLLGRPVDKDRASLLVAALVQMDAARTLLEAQAPLLEAAGLPPCDLETPPAVLTAAVAVQEALVATLAGEPWTDAPALAGVARGQAGPTLAATLERLRALRDLERDLAAFNDLEARLPGLWRGVDSAPQALREALAFAEALAGALPRLAPTPVLLAPLTAGVARLLGEANALLRPEGPVPRHGIALEQTARAFDEALGAFTGRIRAKAPLASRSLSEVCALARDLQARRASIKDWCAWRKKGNEAGAHGLGPLVVALEQGKVPPARSRELFEADYARWWVDAVMESDAVLRTFSPSIHEDRIQAFRDLDDRYTELTRSLIQARLSAGLPDPTSVESGSDWAMLKGELSRKRGQKPLRALLHGMPDAMTRLAPCLLMSPLSIAQYLPPETPPFDLVIFDEASQIAVWDAIGAMARGRQVVMVGDPKQMPPTDFFTRGTAAPDDDDEAEPDQESILDECLGANMPVLELRWHYRSRHESLIAFSNQQYYNGKLWTFPSPVTRDRAVTFHPVDGVYERGGARVNRAEAMALVADLVATLRATPPGEDPPSMGVVTFNSPQQQLIEDLLDTERQRDPTLEPFFAEDRPEPVFVKNLENVQGDERDLIYFSVTFGADNLGIVSGNFGPLNRMGGERRLNVAVTRARERLKVFSSLEPAQIDLGRVNATGVRDLRLFLDMARRGPAALAGAIQGSVGGYDSPFEEAVAQALAARGWQVHPQVGVSRFRIDLGIVDPDVPGSYLAGLECDGATYHRSATARDRDKLREQILVNLGWNIVRLWSPDWWHDAEQALDTVERRLHALLEEARARRAEAEAARKARAAARPAPAVAPPPAPPAGTAPGPAGGILPASSSLREPGTPAAPAPEPEIGAPAPEPEITAPAPEPEITAPAPEPEITAPAPMPPGVPPRASSLLAQDPVAFHAPAYDPVLLEMLHEIVTGEGPVRDRVLAHLVARRHGWDRTSPRLAYRVMALARRHFQVIPEEDGDGVFVWPKEMTPGFCPAFHPPADGEIRPIDTICLAELVALAREVRESARNEEDPVLLMARRCGLQTLQEPARARLEKAWNALRRAGSEEENPAPL